VRRDLGAGTAVASCHSGAGTVEIDDELIDELRLLGGQGSARRHE
jgi:hypothetical protein